MTVSKIIARLDRDLAPKGFCRKKTTWNRESGHLVEVVDVQTSKAGDSVTMNAGVLSRPNYFVCWGRDADEFIEEPFCTVRARVGRLLDNKDRWWDVSEEKAGGEMADCLESRVLPFLERMRSLEGMHDWLVSTGMPSSRFPLPTICLAVLKSQLGDTAGACAVLAELERKALGAWKARAQEVAARIGCVLGK